MDRDLLASTHSYDALDLLTSTAGRDDCSTAVLLEDATRRWGDDHFQFAIRFPDWREGLHASVVLGFGSTIDNLDTCWGVLDDSATLASGGNGQPVILFTLGKPPPDLVVGCTAAGFWQQGTPVVVKYDGSDCRPPPPPGCDITRSNRCSNLCLRSHES